MELNLREIKQETLGSRMHRFLDYQWSKFEYYDEIDHEEIQSTALNHFCHVLDIQTLMQVR